MAKDAKTTGLTFLNEVVGKLPAELQAKAKEVFGAAEAGAAVELLGGAALRQQDYSSAMNEITAKETELVTWQGELNTWFEKKKTDLIELQEFREGKRRVGDPANPNPNPNPANPAAPAIDPAKYLTRDDFKTTLDQTERGAVAFMVELNQLSLQHMKAFPGEILDTDKLITDKRVQQLGLRGVYQEQFKEQLAAKAAAEQKAHDDKLRAEGAQAERERLASTHHPFPVRGNEVSSLDGIEAARAGQAPTVATVDQMAAEYARLQAASGGGPTV